MSNTDPDNNMSNATTMMQNTDSQTLGLLSANVGFLTNMVRDLQTEMAGLRAELASRGSSDSTSDALSPVKKEKKEKKKKKEVPEGHVKKPATAFLMWQNEHFRPTYKEQNPGVAPKDVSSAAGPAWKALTDEEKAPWTEKYAVAKAAWDLATGKPAGGKKVETMVAADASPADAPSIIDQVLGNSPAASVTSDADAAASGSDTEEDEPEVKELSAEEKKAEKQAAKKAAKKAEKLAAKKAAKKAEKLAAKNADASSSGED